MPFKKPFPCPALCGVLHHFAQSYSAILLHRSPPLTTCQSPSESVPCPVVAYVFYALRSLVITFVLTCYAHSPSNVLPCLLLSFTLIWHFPWLTLPYHRHALSRTYILSDLICYNLYPAIFCTSLSAFR